MEAKYKLNYKFREPDSRDYIYAAKNKQTPGRKQISPVGDIYDQQDIGSCVSNALIKSLEMTKFVTPKESSRLFVYHVARNYQGSNTTEDTGCDIRKAVSAIRGWGVSTESSWPYVTKNFAIIPPLIAFQSSKELDITYEFIEGKGSKRLQQIKGAIDTNDPVCFGIQVFKPFMDTGKDGMVKNPNVTKDKYLGGHCMVCIGFNDDTQCFTVCNSWGNNWGKGGMCYIPYTYMCGALASDFCVIQKKKAPTKKK